MTARRVLLLGSAVVALTVAGCAPASDQANSSLPPRPVTLQLDAAPACSMLTDEQRAILDVGIANPSTQLQSPGEAPWCSWGSAIDTTEGYTGGAVLDRGLESYRGAEPLISVDGFAATTNAAPGFDPNYDCGVMVDVAPGQVLAARFSDAAANDPRLNRQVTCDHAKKLASLMISTLRAKQGK